MSGAPDAYFQDVNKFLEFVRNQSAWLKAEAIDAQKFIVPHDPKNISQSKREWEEEALRRFHERRDAVLEEFYLKIIAECEKHLHKLR